MPKKELESSLVNSENIVVEDKSKNSESDKTSNESLLTVLLPVYNAEEYILEAVESVLNQSFTDFQLYILDDGSTDDSIQIINTLKDDRITVVKNDKNLGLIETLNKGLDLVNTKFVARMDADDICHPERFKRQITRLINTPSLVAIGSNVERFGNVTGNSNLPLSHKEISFVLCFENAMAHPTVMMRNSVIKENSIKYRKDLIHMEDWGFWRDLCLYGELANIQESLLKYRMVGQNISENNFETLEIRVKGYYKKFLGEFFENVNQDVVDFHWCFTKAIYEEENLTVLHEKIEKLKHVFLQKFDKEAVNKFFAQKVNTFFFGVCNAEPKLGLAFLFKFRIFSLKKLYYAIIIRLRK